MDKKTPPEAPSVQKLTKEWIELRDLFTGGDPKTIKSVQKMYKENPNVGLQHGVDQAMLAYIQASADSMK